MTRTMKARRFPRRHLAVLVLVAAVGAVAACGGASSGTEASATDSAASAGVAGVLAGTATDGTANQATAEGIDAAAKAANVGTRIVESVPPANADQVIRGLADDGYSVIVAMGSEYQAALEAVAKDYPDIDFINLYTGETTVPNVMTLLPDPAQFGYVTGVAAGQVSTAGHAGLISGADGPDFKALTEAFTKGFQSVIPDGKVDTVISGDYADAQKNTEAARSLLDGGADVLLGNLDAGQNSVAKTAQTAGKHVVGWIFDLSPVAPDAVVVSVITDEKAIVEKSVTQALGGDFQGGQLVLWGPKTGVGQLGPFGSSVTPEQKAAIEAAFANPAG